MYNILTMSDDPLVFSELQALLKKDFFTIYSHKRSELEINIEQLKRSDFILLHLGHQDNENEMMIQTIKKHAICPLYVFSKDHKADQVSRFLEIGSEGHIDIPFKAEMVAPRIKAVLRFLHQIKRTPPNTLRFGRLSLHLDNHEVFIDDKPILLTNVEFKIFELLVENKDTVVSKDKIIHYVWDQDVSATDNALGIHITRLRKKLSCSDEFNLIETIWGLGYRLNLKLCENSNNN